MDCRLGDKWDYDVCDCIHNECSGVDACPENAAFDESCSCQCIDGPESCDGFFDQSSCQCIFDEGCAEVFICPLGEIFDVSVCGCVYHEFPGEPCPENTAFDENCGCQCTLTQEKCKEQELNSMFDSENCLCSKIG
jgi:hypothetical protein